MNVSAELPKYQCHKEVWALKIHEISAPDSQGNSVVTPDDKRYSPFVVSAEYVAKHEPQAGGYYVVYEDGYKSYSPAEPFEAGYTLKQ